MTDEGMKRRGRDLNDTELAGFVRLLLAGDQLPKPTGEVMAYLERAADQQDVDEGAVIAAARAARAVIIKERLGAAHPRPVRALGNHLMAKRLEASCRLEDVAPILGERVATLRALESQTVDPLTLGASNLATVAEVYGLVVSELKQALRLAISARPRKLGASFARSHEGQFKTEATRLAAEDLLRASRDESEPIPPAAEARVESTVAEVRSILERRGVEKLLG